MIQFKQEVEDLLDIKVDVVTENAIHWSMKEDVLNGAIRLWKMIDIKICKGLGF
ncbi:hypothetical protein [Litchfieldia salsa]|uniref:hypothetical protein n=1 Tax=Litchfieldia salsa TaxID=930152 RepID=UPI0015878D2E|nr:hypothetical protein [Litchfieldia salsa]